MTEPSTARWDSRDIHFAKPADTCLEYQVLTVARLLEWPERLGRLWDCDFCHVRFEVGDVFAEYGVHEEDVGQSPYEGRFWFSRIHAYHYDGGLT